MVRSSGGHGSPRDAPHPPDTGGAPGSPAVSEALRNRKVINTKAARTIRTESRITITGSIGEVWAYVCDVGRWPEWAPTVLECWVRGGGPLEPGSRVEQRAKDLRRTHSRSQEVTAVE